MDLKLLRTFLVIIDTGSFVAASRRLNVTPSTVSVRVRHLESLIGKPVFLRNSSSCELTPAGRQFYRYAVSLLRVWEEARHQVAVPDNFVDTLTLGGQYSLWHGFLFDWLAQCRQQMPKTALRLTAGMPRRLLAELLDGAIDVIVVHAPELRPGLVVEELFEDRLILVTTEPERDFRSHYLFMDWGESFREMHASAYPELQNPGLTLEIGSLGLEVLLSTGGAAYFPERIARPYLKSGMMHRVDDSPEYPYPTFAVYHQGDAAGRAPLPRALDILKVVAEQASSSGPRRPTGRVRSR